MTTLNRVKVIAHSLMSDHLDMNVWSFGFDRAKRRAGQCNFTAQRITVSRYFAELHDESDIEQIILHEVAHALAGPSAGHGPEWRAQALRIGYRGGRTTSLRVDTAAAPWVGHCDGGHEHVRYRKPSGQYRCRLCRGPLPRTLIRWQRRP